VAARLGAGAFLRVDSGTQLRLESARELVLERGAVYLDTGSPDAGGATVVVRTSLGLVRDVGTQFQVRVEGTGVGVSVREGAARFEGKDASHEAPSGVRLTVHEDGTVTTREIPRSGPEWDWILEIASPFDLEGRRLGEYLGWVARETGLRIEYADPTIAADGESIILHGSIEGLRPEATLGIVLPTCGLDHTVSGEAVVLRRAIPGSAP
jgi:ferric-dicitrate binding protein FerR (iron transport regulator)